VSASLLERAVDQYGVDGLMQAIPSEHHAQLRYEWRAWARPEQLAPDTLPNGLPWLVWLVLAGRGFGKTRLGAEWVRERVEAGEAKRIIIAGPTAGDVRDVMIEGESGIMAISPPWFMPLYEPSKMRLTWPNGATAVLLSAEEPERFRGKQGDTAWCDELAAWKNPEAWKQLQFGMRLGTPKYLVTTTPQAKPFLKELVKRSSTVITKGSTFDNERNLAADFVADLKEQFVGTRLGRQEIFAELLDDVEGALWNHTLIDQARIKHEARPIEWLRRVVAVDPAGSAKSTADEAGIVVAGIAMCSCKGDPERHAFVLQDISGRYSPQDMGRKAVDAYHAHEADRLVAEDNFGGKIVEDLISLIDRRVAYLAVHASRGKIVRAEPVAALYEQGRVHHVGMLAKLEDELCTYTPFDPKSPGRMDALVWALTDLMLGDASPKYEGYEPSGFGRRM
jgi:phage terminase large subunit-like protein